MTIPEKVVAFLKRHQRNSYCDDCIAKECNLKRRQQAQRVAEPLAQTDEYIRDVGSCCSCSSMNKKVIRAK